MEKNMRVGQGYSRAVEPWSSSSIVVEVEVIQVMALLSFVSLYIKTGWRFL
jgi:hypothetical protein